jgi:hypothetical protein
MGKIEARGRVDPTGRETHTQLRGQASIAIVAAERCCQRLHAPRLKTRRGRTISVKRSRRAAPAVYRTSRSRRRASSECESSAKRLSATRN